MFLLKLQWWFDIFYVILFTFCRPIKIHLWLWLIMGRHGSHDPYIALIAFQLAWTLFIMKHMKFTFGTSCPKSTMTKIIFFSKKCLCYTIFCMFVTTNNCQHLTIFAIVHIARQGVIKCSNVQHGWMLSMNSSCLFQFANISQGPHPSLECLLIFSWTLCLNCLGIILPWIYLKHDWSLSTIIPIHCTHCTTKKTFHTWHCFMPIWKIKNIEFKYIQL